MLHLTNPCAKRKVLSLTKPKGKIYKTNSPGNDITHRHAEHFLKTGHLRRQVINLAPLREVRVWRYGPLRLVEYISLGRMFLIFICCLNTYNSLLFSIHIFYFSFFFISIYFFNFLLFTFCSLYSQIQFFIHFQFSSFLNPLNDVQSQCCIATYIQI